MLNFLLGCWVKLEYGVKLKGIKKCRTNVIRASEIEKLTIQLTI